MPDSPPSLSSVDNALRLLHVLAQRPEVGVAEAGRLLGVARSTAHRLLTTLVAHGFAEQDPESRGYRAGPALAQAGLATIRRFDARTHARPYLEAVARVTGETVHLIVLAGGDSLFLDSVEGGQSVRTAPRVGASFPAYSTSGGKALLAELDDAALRALYPHERLPAVTGETIASRAALITQLAAVRDAGYALNEGESDPQLSAVSAVVRDATGVARFAISVSAPAFRADAETMRELAGAVVAACSSAGRGIPEAPAT
jgi:DNA-binding IclR family transcriptional regulator